MSLEKKKHQLLFKKNPNPYITFYNERINGNKKPKVFMSKKERNKIRSYMDKPNFSLETPSSSR